MQRFLLLLVIYTVLCFIVLRRVFMSINARMCLIVSVSGVCLIVLFLLYSVCYNAVSLHCEERCTQHWQFAVDDAFTHTHSVYSRPLWGKNSPPPKKKIQKSPKYFKMNYAKIEFLSISGMIFSPASGGFAPDPTGALPLVPICLYCLNCTTFG